MALLFIFSLNRAFRGFCFMINSHVSPSDPLFKTSCLLPLHLWVGSSSLGQKLRVRRHLCQHPQCPAQCLEYHGHPDGPFIIPNLTSPHPALPVPVCGPTKGSSAQDASWPTLLGACSQSYLREASSTYTGRCAVSIRLASSEREPVQDWARSIYKGCLRGGAPSETWGG